MGRLDKIKNLINKRLQDMEFTQYNRDCVYAKIEARKKQRRRNYTVGFSAAAFACAAAMVALLVLPAFGNDRVSNDVNSSLADFGNDELDDTADADPFSTNLTSVSGIEVTALNALGNGLIACDSSFCINTENSELNARQVSESLEIQPEVAYTLTMESEDLCLVTIDETLPDGEIVTLSLDAEAGEQSWAFQTESVLTVISTTPGDQSSGMPLDTGIEINFSRILAQNAQQYVKISPSVNGSFQCHGKTMIFVPDEDLEKDTVYTVTVCAGLPASSGETLAEDYTFSFRTPFDYSDGYSYFYYTDSVSQTYTPEETIAFSVNVTDDILNEELSVEIYKLSGNDEYLRYAQQAREMMHATLGSSRDVRFDLSEENPYIQTTTRITQLQTDYGSVDCIILPDLDEGWYVAQVKAFGSYGELTLQKLIQVSSLSLYYQSMNGESLFWLNSTVTGEAVEGASIRYVTQNSTNTVSTDADGIAGISYASEEETGCILVSIESGTGSYAEVLDLALESAVKSEKSYYSYLYLDRAAYLPSDTIHFWGMLTVREPGMALPDTVELQISGQDSCPRRLMEVNVAADGSFTGSFDIENYISGYVTLYVCNEGETIFKTAFTVCEYTKPSYILDLTLDREYYRSGDTVYATAKASFYDGTPAAGVQITVEYNGQSQTLIADSEGCVRCAFTPDGYNSGWKESYIGVNASISGMENVYVWAYASAKYFRGDTMLTISQAQEGTALTLQANAINFGLLGKNLDTYYNNPDLIRGDAVSLTGQLEIVKHFYEKIETGSYYDEIEKRRVDTYDYIYQEETVYTEPFTTADGIYTTKNYRLPELDYGWYTAELSYTDINGNAMSESVRISMETYPYGNLYYYFTYDDSDSFLKLDESVMVQLHEPDGSCVSSGRMLCTLVTDQIVSASVETNGSYRLVYTRNCLPNVRLSAAYFDGEHVYSVPECWFEYDTSEKQLYIEITPSDRELTPGGRVDVDVSIRDAQGNPVEAGFVLSVVDEAAFAVMEQYTNPLRSLYRAIYTDEIVRYASYTDIRMMNVYAEGGAEGGTEGLRENFKDTAAFLTGTTDASGHAKVHFELPENLTSWRITVVAVSKDAEGGLKTENIVTTLDFFVNLVLNETYTMGDDVSMSARVYGVQAGEPVEYEVYLDGVYLDSFYGKSGEYTFINLGALQSGSYEIAIRAVCGDQEDGLIETIEVKSSRHSFLHNNTGLLTEGVKLEADRYPVTLFAYDTANAVYMHALSKLLSTGFSRADRYLGYVLAYEKLMAYGMDISLNAPEKMCWQDAGGGVTLMPYADPDAYTTAMTLATVPNLIDPAQAVRYLYSVLDDYNAAADEVAAAYMGLAAMGEPVLSDVRVLIGEFSVQDDAYYYLSCALALLGDRAVAGQNYTAMFGDAFMQTGRMVYVEVGDAQEDYKQTAHALFLGALLGRSETEQLASYLLDTDSGQYLSNYELMAFITHYRLYASDSTFSCLYNGKTVSFDFLASGVVVLQFNRTELEKANFKVKSGEVSYLAVYNASLSYQENTAAGTFDVSMLPNVNRVQAGKPVNFTVTLNVSDNGLDDVYIVDIVLPSGVRYTGYQYDWNSNYYLISNENGRLRFAVSRTGNTYGSPNVKTGAFTVSFQIYAMAILPGSFVVEEAVAQAPESNGMAIGSRQSLTIE